MTATRRCPGFPIPEAKRFKKAAELETATVRAVLCISSLGVHVGEEAGEGDEKPPINVKFGTA